MLSLLLLQHALAPSTIDARSRLPVNPDGTPASNAGSRPYLKIAGALALRFDAAPPPPDLTVKPPAGAPPQPPAAWHEPSVSSSTNSVAEAETKALDTPSLPPAPAKSTPESTTPPPPILPDDTHPPTRPEDFLPFFQLPGGTNGVNVIVPVPPTRPPAPGQLPPSSATYQQK